MRSLESLRAAVQALDLDEAAWIGAMFEAGRPLLDEGSGLFVYAYRVHTGGAISLGHVEGVETAPRVWQALAEWGAENAQVLSSGYATGVGSLAQAEGAMRGGTRLQGGCARIAPHGAVDAVTVLGHDPQGQGVFLTAPRARRASLARKEQRAYEHLARELGVAAHLRGHLQRANLARLSASEARVAQAIARGASDKDIAGELGVALSTVSTLARRIRLKLGCRAGGEALLLASRASARALELRLALFERLTIAECDVAAALLVGASYEEIARQRAVSSRTVAAQCASIFRKAVVSGRRELAALLLSGK